MPDILKNNDYNPLLEIDTSFKAYLDAHTRTYTDHMLSAGRLDYSFDGDFAMRSRINTIPGWPKLYKAITVSDIPSKLKRLFRNADMASATSHPAVYKAVTVCSERMQLDAPPVIIRKAGDVPKIYSIACEAVESCIVVSSDIAEMCSFKELCFLIGSELGRLQNRHTAFNYAFTYPGIMRGAHFDTMEQTSAPAETAQLSYALNKWLFSADITADRAGIICLEDPADFADVYVSLRRKGLPDSSGNINTSLDKDEVMRSFEIFHTTPVRELEIGSALSSDERRIFAGMEFISCEVLYSWRHDLDTSNIHTAGRQSLEIRCELLAGSNNNE